MVAENLQRLPVCRQIFGAGSTRDRRPSSRFSGSARITRPRQQGFHVFAWNQASPRDLDGGELSFAHQFVDRAASDTVSGCGIIDA